MIINKVSKKKKKNVSTKYKYKYRSKNIYMECYEVSIEFFVKITQIKFLLKINFKDPTEVKFWKFIKALERKRVKVDHLLSHNEFVTIIIEGWAREKRQRSALSLSKRMVWLCLKLYLEFDDDYWFISENK